jgi:hypothetical protein
MSTYLSKAKVVVVALALAWGISYVSAASTWTAPSVSAPQGNTDVPINVGANAQSKQGDLAVGAFLANLNSQIMGNLTIGASSSNASLIIPKGAGSGKVLISDANGVASWGAGGTASSSLNDKSWTDSSVLAKGRTFTVTHGFSNRPAMYRASVIKVSNNAPTDSFPIGTEIGTESFWMWPNSYNSPFSITASASTISVKVDDTVLYLHSTFGDIGNAQNGNAGNATFTNWRLKISAIGN